MSPKTGIGRLALRTNPSRGLAIVTTIAALAEVAIQAEQVELIFRDQGGSALQDLTIARNR